MAITLKDIEQRDVRQFYLINDVEEFFDLTSYLDDKFELFAGFLHTPDGLGYTSENTYAQIHHYDVLTDKKWVNNNITGELIFKSYEQYTSFMYFISHTSKLYLAYVLPFENDLVGSPTRPRVYAQCDIDSINKSEINSDTKLLHCDINIHLLEPFRSERTIRQGTAINTTSSKEYTYTYDVDGNSYKYGISNGEYIIINNVGTADTFPIIRVYGASTAPTISIVDYNTGTRLQAVSYNNSLAEGDVLELFGDPLNQYITLNGLNAYDNINKDLDTYIVFPPGKSILRLTATGGSMEVEYAYKFHSI